MHFLSRKDVESDMRISGIKSNNGFVLLAQFLFLLLKTVFFDKLIRKTYFCNGESTVILIPFLSVLW